MLNNLFKETPKSFPAALIRWMSVHTGIIVPGCCRAVRIQ